MSSNKTPEVSFFNDAPNGDANPLTISVITPSFNQAAFLTQCLDSVANQTYAAIEHLVFDPGSTDDSRDIVTDYPHANLIAEPDKGQSDAIIKGMLQAKGDIVSWLNSDDRYADTDVFRAVVQRFQWPDAPDIVYGKGIFVDREGKYIRNAYVNRRPDTLATKLKVEIGIFQPALFLRRSVIESIGPVAEELHYCMDYEYWIRAIQAGMKFAFLPKVLAHAHYYDDAKTLGQRGESLRELCLMARERWGFLARPWARREAAWHLYGFDGIIKHDSGVAPETVVPLERETDRLLSLYNDRVSAPHTENTIGANGGSFKLPFRLPSFRRRPESSKLTICMVLGREYGSGDSIAAFRLAAGLAEEGHRVHYAFFTPHSGTPAYLKGMRRWHLTPKENKRRDTKRQLFNNYVHLRNALLSIKPDILNLHNMGGFIHHEEIQSLGYRYPIVWTMHDSWAIEQYAYRFVNRATSLTETYPVPQHLLSNVAVENMLDSTSDIRFVTNSKFLRDSIHFTVNGRKDVRVIPNGLPRDEYFAEDQDGGVDGV